MSNQERQKTKRTAKVLSILVDIRRDILRKRGSSAEMWVRSRKSWTELDPKLIRDDTLLEIADLVKGYMVTVEEAVS